MPFYLSAESGFSASHILPGVGVCDRLHGHNYRVRFTVRVEDQALGTTGMAVDFRQLERIAREAVADFEHRHLNDVAAFHGVAPSAEHIARILHDRAAERLTGTATLQEVEVWETPLYRVAYRAPEAAL